jgi:hypothetical protein
LVISCMLFPVFAKGSLGMEKEVNDEVDFPLDKWSRI